MICRVIIAEQEKRLKDFCTILEVYFSHFFQSHSVAAELECINEKYIIAAPITDNDETPERRMNFNAHL